jgi:outer membrane protein insertion porin family
MRYVISVLLLFVATVSASADESAIVIRNLTLIHSDKLSTADEEFVVQEVKSHNYKSTNVSEIAERVRYGFQRCGYFKVIVHDPAFTIVIRDSGSETVDVSVKVDEGEVYRLKEITFPNTSIFSARELRSQFPITDGDILDRDKIAEGLEGMRRLYASKGYSQFSAVPETRIDEIAHTISLSVNLDSGVREGESQNNH